MTTNIFAGSDSEGEIAEGTRSKHTIASITPPARARRRETVLVLSRLNMAPTTPPRPVPTPPAIKVITTTHANIDIVKV